ncbi:hypothetical protein [Georgenia thermotolerans]|uniref:Uncharacterized protein n=1 Tax=Georgenia thermotolerans TaxID=527326 RepID=A0A7J5UK60_9MICO|nr:hypothetical protein [Georgenia thermotolerans]KAE8762716.1 hypothetical protein GB883_17950 [Georgenia thermotolerans]
MKPPEPSTSGRSESSHGSQSGNRGPLLVLLLCFAGGIPTFVLFDWLLEQSAWFYVPLALLVIILAVAIKRVLINK